MKLTKNKTERYEKWTYDLEIDKNTEISLWHCKICHKEVLEDGFFCKEHENIFCSECMYSTNSKQTTSCVKPQLPFFRDNREQECIYIPIRRVIFIGETK